ncbi:DNA translocase FtsK [Succinivibrio dextrinosolvens]|uniref:FtsK/SpoIIIE family protein n=1 Tax=Succinivibrio dextrinosolvens TaxID=83771 RepID=A0A662ZBZ7_9GAMM|nr:DNA translocase FtsK [Succinivibrio dextrinosolvens]SFK18474.1 FtsK/SpoIIIE family protein [Succinivibrio dextrinosolvens]
MTTEKNFGDIFENMLNHPTFDLYEKFRPCISMLMNDERANAKENHQKLMAIKQFLSEYEINATVKSYTRGPVLTRFALTFEGSPQIGLIQVNIDKLEKKLKGCRFSSRYVCKGKFEGGREYFLDVPNQHREIVRLENVIRTSEYSNSKAILPMCLGVNAAGAPVVADLASAPHILIGGYCFNVIHSMLVSMLLKKSPDELRLVLADSKGFSFSEYECLPHLLTPVVRDREELLKVLAWLKAEQERRYRIFSLLEKPGIEDLNEFIVSEKDLGRKIYLPNSESEDITDEIEPLPYIAVIIDDYSFFRKGHLGDISDRMFFRKISDLAQKGKGSGIHIILSTSDFSDENLNQDILLNMPSRMVFKVDNSAQSRMIIDENGAESLMGYGDMILRYQKLNDFEPFRVHGAYVDTDDIHYIVESWIQKAGEPKFVITSDAADRIYAQADKILEKLSKKEKKQLFDTGTSN